MNTTFASPFRNSARKEEKKKLAIAKLFALLQSFLRYIEGKLNVKKKKKKVN